MTRTSSGALSKAGQEFKQLRQKALEFLSSPANIGKCFSLNKLQSALAPKTRETLALVLTDLIQSALVEEIITVEVPGTKGKLLHFPSTLEVPAKIGPPLISREYVVRPGDVRLCVSYREAS